MILSAEKSRLCACVQLSVLVNSGSSSAARENAAAATRRDSSTRDRILSFRIMDKPLSWHVRGPSAP